MLSMKLVFSHSYSKLFGALSRWSLFIAFAFCVNSSLAQNPIDGKARLKAGIPQETPSDTSLDKREAFQIIAYGKWLSLSKELEELLYTTRADFQEKLGPLPPFHVSIELIDERKFFQETKAPKWTNAMYFDGRVLIPLPENGPIDKDNMHRSLRHEMTHAIVNAASAGKCPGWLDEGLAQWSEGPINPIIEKILAKHLQSAEPVPFVYLQGGFTRLDMRLVGPAYAESLFATNSIIRSFGFNAIGEFFKLLRTGNEEAIAFNKAFHMSRNDFEASLKPALIKWARNFKERGRAVY